MYSYEILDFSLKKKLLDTFSSNSWLRTAMVYVHFPENLTNMKLQWKQTIYS